jgi:aminomethyltransferase
LDDAYLYRFFPEQYLLVVNAANREKDRQHLKAVCTECGFREVSIEDRTETMAMLSLQGPASKAIIESLVNAVNLPEPQRNALSVTRWNDTALWLARTGYTAEPLGFEFFLTAEALTNLWDTLLEKGAWPVGLGARDTLRLEAALPLYGHELGLDAEGRPIPVFAVSPARFAVSFSPVKGDFIGRGALQHQFRDLAAIMDQRFEDLRHLSRRIRPLELSDKGVARSGATIFHQGKLVGHVTSGTMVPYWIFQGKGIHATISEQSGRRAIALALIDSHIPDHTTVGIKVRGKTLDAVVMPYLLRNEAPPYARAITRRDMAKDTPEPAKISPDSTALRQWVRYAMDNTRWRQRQCINLIPSEQTASPLVRMLSIMDPMGRYAEHKAVKAFADAQVFYYQGTDFIAAVEAALVEQTGRFLGCRRVETRPVSGQMANMVVFSALVDFINRADRKNEQRRIRKVMNHHIIRGGHLSAQPMGALRDFVMRDPIAERPAVVNFPVLADDPYQIDLSACADLIDRHRPELVILGKSMILYKEPVSDIRKIIDALCPETLLMYDMAHVLGLAGPHFQQPFSEGADLVTGSTHKTFFGTQRGIVAADFNDDQELRIQFWETIERRAFPGAVSNHHPGTLLGLLAAVMEMNAFKDAYAAQVTANAKAFAKALDHCGLEVAGNRKLGFTQTHQVVVKVGYSRAPGIARRLEENNIICNYQPTPEEEGFTASGALRLGVAEMTRFGMREADFESIARLMADVILHEKKVLAETVKLREGFQTMRYCFDDKALDGLMEELHQLV